MVRPLTLPSGRQGRSALARPLLAAETTLAHVRGLLQSGVPNRWIDLGLGATDGAWIATVTVLSAVLLLARAIGLGEPPALPTLPVLIVAIGLAAIGAGSAVAREARAAERRGAMARLLAECRSLAGQALAHIGPADTDRAQSLAWRCIAYAYAVRDHLRAEPLGEAALTALSPEEGRYAASRSNPPNIILTVMSREIATAFSRARMSAESMQTLDDRVVALAGVQATLERLNATAALSSTVLPDRLAIAFALLLPFGLAAEGGIWAPVLVAVLAYAGFGLAALGSDADDPHPIDRTVLSVEISIRDMLGEPDLPLDRNEPVGTA